MPGSLQPASGSPQITGLTGGYSNTTTTIKMGYVVALDIANTTNGRAFTLSDTGLYGGILGVTLDTIPPGTGTAANDAYSDRILRKGICLAQVQGTTGGIAPGDKLIPGAGGVLSYSAAAAAAVSQANFTFAGNIETTTVAGLRAVIVNL